MSKRQLNCPLDDLASKKSKSNGNGHWSMGLVSAMDDPNLLITCDDLVTVIKDKYPKAEFHYLVLPKENISSLKAVTKEHLALLEHMEEIGQEIASERHKDKTFKLGYHAEASMTRLHLHMISDDMNSACVKTKKHWNSFTTEFFINTQKVKENLEENGKVVLPSKEQCKKLLETPLKCHKCSFKPKHMPDLKKHILSHL